MRNIAMIMAAGVVLSATSAEAATVIYTSSTIDQTTNFSNVPLALQQFDPSLGTLTAINIFLNGTVSSIIRFESLDAMPSTITGTAQATVTLARPNGSSLVAVIPTQTRSGNETAFDGIIDFGGTSGDTFINVNGTATDSVNLFSPADFALFTGTGTVNAMLSGSGMSTVVGAGNLVTQISTRAGGFGRVTYTYNESAVPEPASWAMMVGGFGLLGAAMRRRPRTNLTFA
jgi:hypothetical protein